MIGETLPTVVQALASVMEDVQAISKDQRNTTQNYSFRGIDAVVNAVGPALRDHGVVVVPTGTSWVESVYDTRNGARMRNMTVTVSWRFYGPAGDFIDAETVGEAADAGDKATPKAHSVAYRILLLQALCIPTDDPDPDSESHERVAPAAAPPEPQKPAGPKSWAAVKDVIVSGYGAGGEVYAEFEVYLGQAAEHLYGEASLKNLESEQRAAMLQKASLAAVWLRENADDELRGPTQEQMRQAWASVLDGKLLAGPPTETSEPDPDADAIPFGED